MSKRTEAIIKLMDDLVDNLNRDERELFSTWQLLKEALTKEIEQ